MRPLVCALFWFGVGGFCLAMLSAEVGVSVAAFCWLAALFVVIWSVLL